MMVEGEVGLDTEMKFNGSRGRQGALRLQDVRRVRSAIAGAQTPRIYDMSVFDGFWWMVESD